MTHPADLPDGSPTRATFDYRTHIDAQTSAIERMADAITDATDSVNAREFARIAEKSEARLSGYAQVGLVALVVSLLAAAQVTIPVWHGQVPEWMAAPAAWTAAAYGAVAVLIAVTRLADTRHLLTARVNAAKRRQTGGSRATTAAVADPW